jgi:16S rRNA C1402 N4-methylase RsmH
MTFGQSDTYSFNAYDIVNTWGEESIADIIFAYGEDKFSRRIAKKIVEERAKEPIKTTAKLAEIIKFAYPSGARHGKTRERVRCCVCGGLRGVGWLGASASPARGPSPPRPARPH